MSGSKDRGVQFWDPHTGNVQLMLQGHKNSGEYGGSEPPGHCTHTIVVISVAPSPQGFCFATGSGDQRARIWK
jgi:glucose repression regulatory protein TUP1